MSKQLAESQFTPEAAGLGLVGSLPGCFLAGSARAGSGPPVQNPKAPYTPGCTGCGHCASHSYAASKQFAVHRMKALYGAEHVNLEPRSCAQANAAVLKALLSPGDSILRLAAAGGGSVQHGSPSDGHYRVITYPLHDTDGTADTDAVRRLSRQHRPGIILIAPSGHTEILPAALLRHLADESRARLVVSMSGIAGLVAVGVCPNPVEYADVVTTTQEASGGYPGGAILCRYEYAQMIDAAVTYQRSDRPEIQKDDDELPAKLTEREQAVAAFVAQGLTNQEVAEELYVSVKTVEYHLSNIYSKLNITTRRDLRRRYGRRCTCGRR
ncbi:LuxR C-terminal-related transcriptional regulator [Streptomyces sp. TRM72054]|uniref:LuxR C-terminal-related transcriptional regulator n=1 Tax=Streptomyces sp. TRM72054 TaxID=2870562 RepID=UPI001C8C2C6F|nr:LuxR C-terminal-related transcriptional regulator [Streptomyces sp. TRM72054]MBX9399567.1 LuxR C-terminal-related transcriptional regulator [Streptomyces sp. TRM72054]